MHLRGATLPRSAYTLTVAPIDGVHVDKPPIVGTPIEPTGGRTEYFNHRGVGVVNWDPMPKAVHLEAHGWANTTEFAAALDAVLLALTEHHGSLFLADLRNMKVIKQSDQDWFDQRWLPLALGAGLMRIGVVIPKSGLAEMNIADMLERAVHTSTEVRSFATVEEATEWLVSTPNQSG